MFGHNKIEKQTQEDILQVVKGSPFYTIQGEGPYAGIPAVFIRLHGCNLRCWFCDTKFDDPEDPYYSPQEIAEEALRVHTAHPTYRRLAVITGGEPFRQPLNFLVSALRLRGFFVQIETAGTLWYDNMAEAIADYVVSPKTPKIHPEIMKRAFAFKYIISAKDPLDPKDGLPLLCTQFGSSKGIAPPARPGPNIPIYLSPMDEYHEGKNRANIVKTAEIAMKYGYRFGLQLHKIIGLP